MSDTSATVDFGAPDRFGAHLFRIEISAGRSESVRIVEDYGYRGEEDGVPREEERVILARVTWSAIAECARREFNDRLKAAKMRTAALRPEERWWLFAMTVAEAGLPEDTQRGWRRALFHALSDGEKPAGRKPRRRPIDSDVYNLSLFKDIK
jgi:hypothetical protein